MRDVVELTEAVLLPPPPPVPEARPATPRPGLMARAGRPLRIAAAVALLGLAAAFVADRFLTLEAGDALLDGAPVTLRTPIGGTLTLAPALSVGNVLPAGARLGAVANPRADGGRLADLSLMLATAEAELGGLDRRVAHIEAGIAAAGRDLDAFRAARGATLAARIAEGEGAVRGAAARLEEATRGLRRSESLAAGGIIPAATLDAARRAAAVATADRDAAANRRAALEAEARAAEGNVFAADAATDRSASQQQRDRLRDLAAEVAVQRAEREARVAALRPLVEAERDRLALAAAASLTLGSPARLVRLVAGAGEHLAAGAAIAVLADCTNPEVTATVPPALFRRLSVGSPARFRGGSDGPWREGQVAALRSEPAAVAGGRRLEIVVALPAADAAVVRACESGRLGRLTF